MKPSIIACVAALLTLAACGTMGSTLSGRQIESLSPGEVRTRAMGQLNDTLVPYKPVNRYSRGESPGPKPLEELNYATRPYGYHSGWCRFDALELFMSPRAAVEMTPATPVSALGVTVQSAFLQLKPEVQAREETPAERAALHSECIQLDPHDKRFIRAPDLQIARAGQKAYREMIAGMISGNPNFESACSSPGGERSCKDVAERDRPLDMLVEPCGDRIPFPTCLRIQTYGNDIDVTLTDGVIRKVVIETRVFVL